MNLKHLNIALGLVAIGGLLAPRNAVGDHIEASSDGKSVAPFMQYHATLPHIGSDEPRPADPLPSCSTDTVFRANYLVNLNAWVAAASTFESHRELDSFGDSNWRTQLATKAAQVEQLSRVMVATSPPSPQWEVFLRRQSLAHGQIISAMLVYQDSMSKQSSNLMRVADVVYYSTEELIAAAAPFVPPACPASPTPTPGPEPLVCTLSASVNNPNPQKNTNITLTAVLSCSSGSPGGALMTSSWHFKTTTTGCDNSAAPNGVASCTRSIGNATSGYFVQIDVTMSKSGEQWHASTGFTPQ